MGQKLAYQANRAGVVERFSDPAVQKSVAGALALIGGDDQWRTDVELTIVPTAKQHDAHKIAVRLRGGLLPQAEVSPEERRATRDLLRRRVHLTRQRAELLTHVQPTNWPDHLPARGQKIADQAHRHGVAARFPDPAVHKRVAVALALIAFDDQ